MWRRPDEGKAGCSLRAQAETYDEKFFLKEVLPLVAGARGRQAEKDGDPSAGACEPAVSIAWNRAHFD